jgi:GNAT superfamily N-acetyltransferase
MCSNVGDIVVMKVVTADENDFPAWLHLAKEVEPLFGPMVHETQFLDALRKNINRGSAFCVRDGDGSSGNFLLGGLLWSAHPPQYEIGWLAVTSSHRRQGVGRNLIEHALGKVVPPAIVGVTTFAKGLPGGESSLNFYRQLGFVVSTITQTSVKLSRQRLERTI